eukprot:ctg_1477.g401
MPAPHHAAVAAAPVVSPLRARTLTARGAAAAAAAAAGCAVRHAQYSGGECHLHARDRRQLHGVGVVGSHAAALVLLDGAVAFGRGAQDDGGLHREHCARIRRRRRGRSLDEDGGDAGAGGYAHPALGKALQDGAAIVGVEDVAPEEALDIRFGDIGRQAAHAQAWRERRSGQRVAVAGAGVVGGATAGAYECCRRLHARRR